MSDTPVFASTREALGMLRVAMGYLAAADPTTLAADAQAERLQELEQIDAIEAAARAKILGAFTAGQGYCADGDYSPRSWLIHRTRHRVATGGHVAWARRAAAHPQVAAALAGGQIPSESYARKLCDWTDKLPGDCRDAADAILVAASAAGAALAGWLSWPRRCTPGPAQNMTGTPSRRSRTGGSRWRLRSAAPGC